MKNILPILLVILCLYSNAQITIYQQDLPQPGDTFMLYVDKTPSVSLGTASATAQVWNYSALGNDSTKYAPYGITSNLAFSASFPNSNTYTYGPAVLYGGPGAPSPGAGVGYTMWSVNSTGMWVEGYRSDYDGHGEKNINPNPKEMLMPVPCTYGHNQNYDSKWEVSIAYVPTDFDTIYRSRTHKNISCDAWGSMETPLGLFNNVIRVHEFSVTTDSVFASFGGTTYYSLLFKKDTINKYLFWAPTERHPVAIAYCNNAGILQRIEYVSWAHLNVNHVNSDEVTVAVFPNPVSDYATIKVDGNFKGEKYLIRILDLTGKEIFKQNSKDILNTISVKTFDQGLYFVEIETVTGKVFKSNFIVK